MPIYEYSCPKCGRWDKHRAEYKPRPYEDCPYCGAPSRKLISCPSMIIIGAPLGDKFFQRKYLNPYKQQADVMKTMEERGDIKKVKPWAQKILKEHIKGGLERSE